MSKPSQLRWTSLANRPWKNVFLKDDIKFPLKIAFIFSSHRESIHIWAFTRESFLALNPLWGVGRRRMGVWNQARKLKTERDFFPRRCWRLERKWTTTTIFFYLKSRFIFQVFLKTKEKYERKSFEEIWYKSFRSIALDCFSILSLLENLSRFKFHETFIMIISLSSLTIY